MRTTKHKKKKATAAPPIPLKVLILAALQHSGGTISSDFRLNKLLYLTDWYHALSTGRQLSPLRWTRRDFGPWLPDVREEADRLKQVQKTYYQCKEESVGTEYVLRSNETAPPLEETAIEALSAACLQVIGPPQPSVEKVKRIVYATLPMKHARVGELLNIEEWAEKERHRRTRRFAKKVLPRYGPLLRELAK